MRSFLSVILLCLLTCLGCNAKSDDAKLALFAERAHIYEEVDYEKLIQIIEKNPEAYMRFVDGGRNEFSTYARRVFIDHHREKVPDLVQLYVKHGTRPTFLHSAYTLTEDLKKKVSIKEWPQLKASISSRIKNPLDYCSRNPILTDRDFIGLAHLLYDFGQKPSVDEFQLLSVSFFDLPINSQLSLIEKYRLNDPVYFDLAMEEILSQIDLKIEKLKEYRYKISKEKSTSSK